MTSYKKEFIENLVAVVRKFGGISPNLQTVIVAQGCLESGFGKYGVNTRGAKNNIFGLNHYDDKYTSKYAKIELSTTQYRNGKYEQTVENFCVFDSVEDAVECLINWYDRPGYDGIKNLNIQIKDITNMLTGRYATDPRYAKKLIALINEYNIKSYFNEPFKICIGSFTKKENADRLLKGFKANYNYHATIERQNEKGGNYRVVVLVTEVQLKEVAKKFSYFKI